MCGRGCTSCSCCPRLYEYEYQQSLLLHLNGICACPCKVLIANDACDAAQPISDTLLSQALLPVLAAGDGVTLQSHSSPDASSSAQLCWSSPDPSTSGQQGSAEDALLTVLRFIAGKHIGCADSTYNSRVEA